MQRVLVVLLIAFSAPASASTLTVRLLDAHAAPNGTEWLVALDVELDNTSGAPIVGQTNFASALDGTSLVIVDASGRALHEQAYVHHQSPYSQGRPIAIPMGRSVQHIAFPVPMSIVRGMRARLQGSVAGRPDLPIYTSPRAITLR